MQEIRTYRNWVEDKDLVNFAVKIGESDLFIRADKALNSQAKQCLHYQRSLIQDYIQKNTDAKVYIWLGSCFGACDTPKADVDLLIQWGHNKF